MNEEKRMLEDHNYNYNTLGIDEVDTFLDGKRRVSRTIANATSLCILSPALLIALAVLADEGGLIPEALAVGVGMTVLLGMVAVAVFLFITGGVGMKRYDESCFQLDQDAADMAREAKNDYEATFASYLAVGVVLCILSALPIIIAGALNLPDYIFGCLVSMLLVTVAIGVNMIIRVCVVKGSYDILLRSIQCTQTYYERRLS